MATPPLISESDKKRTFPASIMAASQNRSVGGAANAAATVALTGSSTASPGGDSAHNNPVKCSGVWWSYSGTPTGGRLTINDGTSNVIDIDITTGGPGFLGPFEPPLSFERDIGVTLTLAAGGAGVTGKVGIHAWQER